MELRLQPDSLVLSTVVLSWDRPELLKRTLDSYGASTKTPHELIVVDNGSAPETIDVIRRGQELGLIDRAILLAHNEGGRALNRALGLTSGAYIHISENDLEYREGWDDAMLSKFVAFPDLGQLSPFAPEPEWKDGEVWVRHEGNRETSGGQAIWVTEQGVGTTCVFPRSVLDAGVEWTNIEGGRFRWPNDAAFSRRIRALGWRVAWNDQYVVTNWGHNVSEWRDHLLYYLEGYEGKSWVGLSGLEGRLRTAGYRLQREADGTVVGILPLTDG